MQNKLIDHINSRPLVQTDFEYTPKEGVKADTVYCVPKNKSEFEKMIADVLYSLERFDEIKEGKKTALQRLVSHPLKGYPYRWQKTTWDKVSKHEDASLKSAGSKLYPGNPKQTIGQVAAGLRRAMRRILDHNENKNNISLPEIELINVWANSLEEYFYANQNFDIEPKDWQDVDRIAYTGRTKTIDVRIKQWNEMFDITDKMRIKPINVSKKYYDQQNQKLTQTGLFQ
tara:strand:+ start:67 stop:753 length:687 start_codon:yes stop_codon:yes gene_type:complete